MHTNLWPLLAKIWNQNVYKGKSVKSAIKYGCSVIQKDRYLRLMLTVAKHIGLKTLSRDSTFFSVLSIKFRQEGGSMSALTISHPIY